MTTAPEKSHTTLADPRNAGHNTPISGMIVFSGRHARFFHRVYANPARSRAPLGQALINTFLGNSSAPLALARFVGIDSKEVLQIDCSPAQSPVYLTGGAGGEVELYIRRQASSVKLKLDEAVAYIRQRFASAREL